MIQESLDILPLSLSSMLNSLLYAGPDVIINAHYPMKNLGQTWIFYKPGLTHITQIKRDSVDWMTWMTHPDFNPAPQYMHITIIYKLLSISFIK